ncbi:MAG: hypothetical protein HUJ62_01270 [Streptococcus gallolyticus]|nr:hypothetical protein [Streptococcus gallolyticus]
MRTRTGCCVMTGLQKGMDFTGVTQKDISRIVTTSNNIPRKSQDYKTPIQAFNRPRTHVCLT